MALRISTVHDFRVIGACTWARARTKPQTKLDREINSDFLLSEHGNPRISFSGIFAKNSLIKNIFEEEKKFDSGTWFFFGKKSPTGYILAKART